MRLSAHSPEAVETEATMHDRLRARGAIERAATAEERATMLDETEWSFRFDWKQLVTFAKHLRLYRLPPGKSLFNEGDHDAFLAIVVHGALEILKHDLAEHSRVVAEAGVGKMVGEMSLLDGAPRSATAVAAKPTEVLVFTKDDYKTLADTDPALAFGLTWAIATVIAQLLRETTGTLVEYLDP